MNLLQSLQNDILDDSIPLSTILRKATVLAYKLGNDEFKNWVRQEQDGYAGGLESVPEYRKISTGLFGQFIGRFAQVNRAPIPTLVLPNDKLKELASLVVFFQGVKGIEELLNHKEEEIKFSWPSDLLIILQRIPIYEDMICAEAWRPINKSLIAQILDTVRNRLLVFVLELEQTSPNAADVAIEKISQQKVQQLFQNIIVQGNLVQGGTVATFDQRNQQVGYQYNAAGDINFNNVQNRADAITELEKLQNEMAKAIEAGLFEEGLATDAEYHLKKASQEAQKPESDKKSILMHLGKVKDLITGVGAAAGLVKGVAEAIEIIQKLF